MLPVRRLDPCPIDSGVSGMEVLLLFQELPPGATFRFPFQNPRPGRGPYKTGRETPRARGWVFGSFKGDSCEGGELCLEKELRRPNV